MSASMPGFRTDLVLQELDEVFPALLETYLRAPGSEKGDEADCYWIRTTIPFPVYGGVYKARFSDSDAEKRIVETLERVRARSEPASWFVGPGSTPADLPERLAASGLEKVVELTGMAIDLNDLAPAPEIAPEVRIGPAEAEEAVRDYARIYPLLFGASDTGFIADIEASEVASWRSGDDHLHRYIAYKSGKAICAGATSRRGACAVLDTLCTLPEERNQGIGAALATRGLLQEQADGAEYAIIWAGPGAEKLYARMGFATVCKAPVFLI